MTDPLKQLGVVLFVVDVSYGYLKNFGTEARPDWGATALPYAHRFDTREGAEAALKAFKKPGTVRSLGETC